MEHKLQNIADLGKDTSCLHHIFGFDTHKRQNLLLADASTLVYASSTAVVFENLENNEKQYLLSLDDNGVGCITTHQSRYGICTLCYFNYFNIQMFARGGFKACYHNHL